MKTSSSKNWMQCDRISKEYLDGVKKFLDYAFSQEDGETIQCPCKECVLHYSVNRVIAYDHLVVNGIMPLYDTWFCHGEPIDVPNCGKGSNCREETFEGDDMVRMINDAFGGFTQFDNISEMDDTEFDLGENTIHSSTNQSHPDVEKFDKLIKDANEELYPGCKKFSKLSFLLYLYHIKLMFKWTNESFNALLGLLKDALPEGEKLPHSYYETKKIVDRFGLRYEKIHACPNYCMLFRNDLVDSNECSNCHFSSWKDKDKKIPAKVLRYFPLKPRLQRLFMSSKTSKLMRWHDEERNKDGVIIAKDRNKNYEAWKNFDSNHLEFAKDPRNVHLGLASDGFNPYGKSPQGYSIWPVILMPYNLPPWLCVKQEFFILSLLIPGPKQPGNNIYIFLEPLIEELKELWDVGVETYDTFAKDTFQMRAALMWTINDFSAYGALFGWSTNGRFACPCCNIHTQSRWLFNGKKFYYMGHRRSLGLGYEYRNDTKSFDGTKEFRTAPCPTTGSMVLEQVRDIEFTLGRLSGEATGVIKHTWKKRSIFFKLSYWKYNLVRHNLDVMHIEKNVCDNVLYTLLDIGKKSKDNLEAQLDWKEGDIIC